MKSRFLSQERFATTLTPWAGGNELRLAECAGFTGHEGGGKTAALHTRSLGGGGELGRQGVSGGFLVPENAEDPPAGAVVEELDAARWIRRRPAVSVPFRRNSQADGGQAQSHS